MKLLAVIFLILLAKGSQAALRCNSIQTPVTALEKEAQELVDINLYTIQQQALEKLTPKAIRKQNLQRLKDMDRLPFRSTEIKDIDRKKVQALIKKTIKNSVAGNKVAYEREGVEIGYCFGRATFVHLEALRLGYQKEQIKKLWVVGPMVDDKVNWIYHVATTIRGKNGQWWVIDPFFGDAMLAQEWFDKNMPLSTDQKLHFFVTNPEKFSPYAGKYSRLDLGLDMSKKDDYYKGYFQDLMQTLKPAEKTKVE